MAHTATQSRNDLKVRLDPGANRFAGLKPNALTGPERNAVICLALDVLASKVRFGPLPIGEAGITSYLQLRHGDHDREVFGCLFLTARKHLIADEELFFGSIDRAAVYPRVIVQRALRHNAAALICYHNHPGSVAEPTPADVHTTKRIRGVVDELDISLLDHIVVSRTEAVSMAARRLI